MSASYYCCRLRTLVLCIGVVFLSFQAALLVATLLQVGHAGERAGAVVDWLVDEAVAVGDETAAQTFRNTRKYVARRAYDFLAIPITLNIVLMVTNALLVWAALSKHKILLFPWLVLYTLEWLVAVVLLILLLITVPRNYIKVLLFLVICPFLVVFAFCLFVVKCFYNYLRDLRIKEAVAAIYQHHETQQFQKSTLPPTVYSMSDPLHRGLQWDQPLPIWATATPVAATATASAMAVNGWEGPSVDANCHHDARFGRRSRPQPTRLADGTLVVPIADESDDEDIIGEEEEEELSGIAEEDDVATRNAIRAGRRIVVQKTAASEDGTSVISLSDKYRQQEEMDVFEEFYPVMVARP